MPRKKNPPKFQTQTKIREIRERKMWSQEEAAVWSGISRQTYIRAEQGGLTTTIETYMRIAMGLGVSVVQMIPVFGVKPGSPKQSPPRRGRPAPKLVDRKADRSEQP